MAWRENAAALAARAAMQQAAQVYERTIRREFPAGWTGVYSHGEYLVEVEVIDHSDDRVKVRSLSGAEYWIGAYRLLEPADDGR